MKLMSFKDADPQVDSNGVPWCREECHQHDGKRCRALGLRPSTICEPAVIQMAEVIGATSINSGATR